MSTNPQGLSELLSALQHQESDIPVQHIEALEDGSNIFEVGGTPEESEEEPIAFTDNLAHHINEANLSALSARLLENIESDDKARDQWLRTVNLAMKYIGWRVEESKTTPFAHACSAYDTTLSSATLTAYSTIIAELLPSAGPVHVEVIGTHAEEMEDRADRIKLFLNDYLTNIDKEYYSDFRKCVLYTVFCGSGFKKVYQDPFTNRPTARFIKPQDFIVNPNTTSLLSADRMSHKVWLTRKEVILNQMSGVFVEDKLPGIVSDDEQDKKSLGTTIKRMDGVDASQTENKSLFLFYETHVDLTDSELYDNTDTDSDRDELPKPYIIKICESTKKVVSIRRNWEEGDERYSRLDYFVRYFYAEGFGIYGTGLAHLMGSNAIVLTNVLRQLMDAGTLKNFPGGLKIAGLKIETNDLAIGPSEFKEIDTGGLPIQQCVMLMPYTEPSTVLMQLRTDLMGQSLKNALIVDEPVPEAGINAPVGTTLALLDVRSRDQSTVLKSFRDSLKDELKLIATLFRKNLQPGVPYPFAVPGKSVAIMQEDFNDTVNVVPVSDPNVLTSTHRLLRAEAINRLSSTAPQLYDPREVQRLMLKAMNVDNIDKLLPPKPEPSKLDAKTENLYALQGKPIIVDMQQDHDAHIMLHDVSAEELKQMGNIQAYGVLSEHNQVHKAARIAKLMIQEQVMQQVKHGLMDEMMAQQFLAQSLQQLAQMPTPQLLQNMEIQNRVSKEDLVSLQTQQQNKMMEMQKQQQIQQVPNELMKADIEQRSEASKLKHEESQMKVEADAFKAQLNFESDKAKMDTQREIAVDKNLTNLTLSEMKLHEQQLKHP